MAILLGFIAFFVLLGIIYVILTLMTVPGLAEERLGVLEPLPTTTDWRDDTESHAGKEALTRGQRRQERVWADPARDILGRERFLHQVRYLDASTGEVVSAEPDRRIKRRRIRSR